MKKLLMLACLCLAVPSGRPAALQQAAEPEVMLFCLRDGRTVWGTVEGHDESGLRARRLVGEGLVHLPWSFLDPEQERELRLVLGYVDEGANEIVLDADRLVLRDGTELVGRIVERADGVVWVKRAGGSVPIPLERVATTSLVRAPALDLYSREELYQRFAGELAGELVRDGEAGARAHVELAQTCERFLDYAHAVEHYTIARALDSAYRSDLVTEALARSTERAALQEQVDLLAEADQWRGRGKYDRAWAILNAFPERFPGSPLLEDWNRMRRRVERTQERELREAAVDRVHHWVSRLLRDAVRRIDGFEASRAWTQDALERELFVAVQADLARIAPAITADEVRRLWDERQGGRYRQASYGLGTWLLGEERALSTPGEEPVEETQEGTQQDARKRLEERIKRYLENQEVLRRNQERRGQEEDPEAFWSAWSASARAQWLLADFVETAGVFRLDRVRFANCRECGGTGVRQVAFTGGAISGQTASSGNVVCPTCHGIARVRRVRYR